MRRTGGSKGKRNLLLAATIISLSTTMMIQTPVKAGELEAAIANEAMSEYTLNELYYLDSDLGTLAGDNRDFTILGNTKGLRGNNKIGITTLAGQTLTIKDLSSFGDFTTYAITNGGTVEVQNVAFADNTTDINNTGTLNLLGNNEISTIIGAGITNITGGTTEILRDGSVVQNAINLKGGRLVNSGTITANVAASEAHSASSDSFGGAIYNKGTISEITGIFKDNTVNHTLDNSFGGAIFNDTGSNISTVNADFTNNTAFSGGAIYNMGNYLGNGVIDKIIGDFTGNKALGASEYGSGSGGAISNFGTINQLSGSFTNNTALVEAAWGSSGGAIYNNGTLTIKSLAGDPITFSNNQAYNTGGAIANSDYSTKPLTITADGSSITFEGNSAKNGGALYNNSYVSEGTPEDGGIITLNATGADITFTGNTATEKGGAIYNNYGATVNMNSTGENKISFATSSDTIHNEGTININGNVVINSLITDNATPTGTLNLNGGTLKLNSTAANSIAESNLKLNGGTFDIANNNIDDLTFANAINNAVNSYIALDVSLGETNTADKITSDITGASTIYLSDLNFISDNKNGGEVQIADGNIKGQIALQADVLGGYADVQYDNTTGVLSFADKIDWLQQTNGNQSGYRFTKTDNGIMPVNYTSGDNNYTFYTDILRKSYIDNNSVSHDLKYTWNNANHRLTVTNSDDTAVAQTTMGRTGAGSAADPYVLTGDYTGNNSSLGFARWDRVGSITGDFIGNTKGGIGLGMGITIGDIKGNFIGNSGGRAFSFSGDHSWSTNINSITGDFIGNSGGAVYIMNWNNGGIGTVTGDFIGNKADGDAGAIWLADGYINSLTGNFINNYAGVDAGALLVGGGHNGANITVIGDFIGNQAVDQGGAIYNWSGATTRLIDSSFIGNIASEGAAIYIDKGELSVTALNKDIEFTNNNSTGTAGGEGYGIYHKSSGYRPFALNAYEGRTITVNDKVYSEQKINLNCYYSGDWVGKNGTIIFNNEFTQTGATEISSNESNAGGGTVIFNGTTSLADLDVSGTATLKLGSGAGTSTFGAVTFTRSPILDIANDSAQTLTVASIKGNSKLNIDLDFSGASVLADAINISTGGQTGVLTLDSINALTSETGAIRSFSELEILKGTTTNVTLALSETLQQDERFFGDEVESVTREVSTFADNATFGQFEDNKFTDTVYAHKTQNRLYLDDTKTKLSFDCVETAAEYVKSSTSQDVLQSLNQSTSATRSLTTDDATKTYTAGADLGATGTGSLTVSGTTSGENTSTLNMSGKSGFELSNANTTLNLTNLNITGVKDTANGGLINITGADSKANLENVTITSTTNSAISNAVELNLNGTNNLGTGITGTGVTKVNGGKSTVGSITQNAVNIAAGELEAANITTTSGISNAGTLILTGTANANTISGTGHTVIKNTLDNTGAINQAVEVANTGNLTTAADKLGGTVTNAGTLNLSGTLDKAIAGAGITKVNSALTFLSSADLSTGTLDLNNGALTLSGDSTATEYTVNSLTGSGNVNIDIDYSGATPVADSIRIAAGGGTGTVTVDSITSIGTATDSFSVDILKGNTTGLTLAISETLANQYKGDEVTDITHETEAYQANIDFDKKSFDTVEYTQKSQKTLSVNGNKLDLAVVITEAKHETGRTSEDALATLNTTSGSRSMKATTAESSNAYKLTKDLGNTASGDITVEGRSSSDLGQLDMDGYTGFNVANAGTTVNLKNLNITNTKAEDGSLINITNSGSSANLEGVTVASNTSNVISSNGTLGVTNSTVNAGVNNNGTMNLNGTNQVVKVEGSNGTANVQTGTTTVGSIFQKLINIVSGGKLASNGDVTATNGITNNSANGLSVANGTLTGDVTGSGTTDFSGTSAIADGSTVGQAITVIDGKLTTLADSLGGAVTNGGTVQLDGGTLSQTITGGNLNIKDSVLTSADNLKADTTTVAASKDLTLNGGNLTKDITGSGNTKIAGTVTNSANIQTATEITSGSLDNTNGNLANVTVTSGSLKSNADNISGTVANNGTYEITGGTIANAISGTGAVNITGNVINNAVNTTTGAVSVADNVELAVGTSGDAFASASSVTMGNNSTLNIQNGATTNAVMDNLIIATGDNVNVKMDWNDTINSSSGNINGNLTVTDINMATSTSSYEATSYAFTNLGSKIALSDPVSLSNVSDTTNNFVSYNNTTGQLTSFRNSLMRAVDKTEAGETATYVMTGDETAGGQTLEGKLLVQGDGHTITTAGVKVHSSTATPAELTLQDTNMNVAGKAIEVTGNNKAIVKASGHDITLQTTDSSEVVSLNKSGTDYAQAEMTGAKTITINGDIKSDDVNNTLTIASGSTVNHAGLLDPITTNVNGTYNRTSGYDETVTYNVNSGGALNFTNDMTLYDAGHHTAAMLNTINFNGGSVNTINGVVTDFQLANMSLTGTTNNFYADVDLANQTMDKFTVANPVTGTGTLNVAGLNLISDAANVNTTINFTTDPVLMAATSYTGGQGLTALSPIYKYNVGYDNTTGNFDFTRYNTGGYGDYNPSILAAPVAAQMGGYLTQLNSYDEAFYNMDMYMLMTKEQRQALKFKNKYASADGKYLYDSTLLRQERAEGWFRPFATFEKVGLKNGPKVGNVAYGTYMGGESEMYDLGHGWDGIWGAYVGYNGSHQNYDGVSIYQNGGTLGVLGMAYKGNFFTGLTINAGASGVEASTMYGNEDFAMLMAGIASKTGYNWELFNGKFIIQPSMLMSYSFVNTFDYKNAAGVNVDSDPLHAIQLQPEIKFIGNLKNGWQPYASVAVVWNIMDDTKFKANDVALPELSVKPYVKYGVGVRKTWGERLTGFFQTYITNGGRNGVGLQAGFTWALGRGSDKNANVEKIQKSLNKVPELEKTEIVLNGKKVQ